MGSQARPHGARPARPRRLHARNRGHDRPHRRQSQGIQPRQRARRLRHAHRRLPQLRRPNQGKLPPLRLHGPGRRRPSGPGLRLFHHQNARRPHPERARSRGAAGPKAHRPARRLSQQGRLALHRRTHAGRKRRSARPLQAGIRLWRQRPCRRNPPGRARAGRPAQPGPLPALRQRRQAAGQKLRVRKIRGHQRRPRQLRLQKRPNHPSAAHQRRANGQAAANGQNRPARQIHQQPHPPPLCCPPGLERRRWQGDF